MVKMWPCLALSPWVCGVEGTEKKMEEMKVVVLVLMGEEEEERIPEGNKKKIGM